jgi:6-phosphogluconolactonase
MKFRKFGRISLALAVSLGTGLGVTSCSTDHTVGYFYVTGQQYNQVSAFRIDSNLGNLYQTQNSPYGAGGFNPIRVLVANAGRFLYVLNAGCGGTGQSACPSGVTENTGPNISLFTIGGAGALSFQATYTSQGNYPVSIQTDSSGTHLFVLDSQVPDPTTCVAYVSSNPASICGDITSFNIDPNTGRLSLITNEQFKNPTTGANLTYFPVGSGPINFVVVPSNSYIYTIEKGSGSSSDPSQGVFVYANTSGQLTLTQNTPIATTALDLSFIYASSKYIYLIDATQNTTVNPAGTGQILPYTIGTNGALQSLVGGAVQNPGTVANPGPMIVDHQGKFLYLANQGPNLTATSPASSVSAFFIDPTTGRLTTLSGGASGTSVVFGSGAEPQCIIEDPSNQYLYTANYDDSSITGAVINSTTGTLTTLRKLTTFTGPGNPTWCAASGTLF